MITNKEVLRNVLIIILLYTLLHLVPQISLFHYYWSTTPLILILGIFYLIIYKKLRNRKRISEYIKPGLAAMNYTILSERPLTLKEQYENYELDFGPFINGVSINVLMYKSQMKRHFVVKNEKDHDFELIISIIQTWRDKFKFRIESTSRIRN